VAIFPPASLRDYSLLADGERGALLGPLGDIVWLCAPRWDSPAAFASLIGGEGGWAVCPTTSFTSGGAYEPGSLIWRTRFVTATGELRTREAMALPGLATGPVLLRRIEARRGAQRVRICLSVRSDFGRGGVRGLRQADDGSWSGELGEPGAGGTLWHTPLPGARPVRAGRHVDLEAEVVLQPGEHLDLALRLSTGQAEPLDCEDAWAATAAGWGRRVPQAAALPRLARRDVQHGYAVLRGMTSATGGMVAAATLGLPEQADDGRSYDYRYAWIRDQCFVGQTAARGPDLSLLDSAVRFVSARLIEHGPRLAPAYRTDGAPVPDEQTLDLPGYPGGRPIVGNWVNHQLQLDAFGDALLLFAAADEADRLDADGWRAAEIAVEALAERGEEPDAGIWELPPEHWTHSALTAAAGLRAVARRPRADGRAGVLAAMADAFVARAASTSLHRTGRWQRSPTDERVDAALLLPTLRGALPPDDPRAVLTLRAVLDELTEDGYAYRFRHGDLPLGRAEGSFLLCGFVVAAALLQQGDHVGAARWFERSRSACGTPALFTEEVDVTERQLRGNLPQAFVHAMMVQVAIDLDAALPEGLAALADG